jgi:ABC-type transporter lipoprotein component MlaA
LRSSSVDYYAALRNAYYQTRSAEIWDRRAPHLPIAGKPAAPAPSRQ